MCLILAEHYVQQNIKQIIKNKNSIVQTNYDLNNIKSDFSYPKCI